MLPGTCFYKETTASNKKCDYGSAATLMTSLDCAASEPVHIKE